MTIYYDAFTHGLIPCKFLGWAKTPLHELTGSYNAVVKLTRSKGPYKAGEVLHLPRYIIVEKAFIRDYQQKVRTASLPPVDPDNLIPARC